MRLVLALPYILAGCVGSATFTPLPASLPEPDRGVPILMTAGVEQGRGVQSRAALDVSGIIPPAEYEAAAAQLEREGRIRFYTLPAAAYDAMFGNDTDARARLGAVSVGGSCVVYIRGGYPDWYETLLRRHERGHCGGWGGSHAGGLDPTMDYLRALGA